MLDLQARARAALAGRLREIVPTDALHERGTHTIRLADALVPSIGTDDVRWARDQLAARAKGELRPTRANAVPLHAAWSSTALVASAFAPWRRRPGDLPLAGLGPFSDLRLEERLHIPHGGGTPNLDVALDAPTGLVGVESKLTEHLSPARARPWRAAYRREAMLTALAGGWATTFADLLSGRWAPRHLDAGQLVRHALSLRGRGDLVLVYWEPADADDHPECAVHRREVAELIDRTAGAPPRLHASTWSELLDVWAPVKADHVAALRRRYDVALTR